MNNYVIIWLQENTYLEDSDTDNDSESDSHEIDDYRC